MIPIRGLLGCAVLLLSTLVAYAQGTVKHFATGGLSFDYPGGWIITDDSNSDAQQLMLARTDSDARIRIFVHRGNADSPEKFAKARTAIIDPYVKSFNETFVSMGAKPESSPATSEVGGVSAEGVRLRASLSGEPGEASIFWLTLNNRVTVLTFFGPDTSLKQAAPAWEMIRSTIKTEPPRTKSSARPSPSPKP